MLFDLARIEVRKTKADVELSLARDQKVNKKGFYKYMNYEKKG